MKLGLIILSLILNYAADGLETANEEYNIPLHLSTKSPYPIPKSNFPIEHIPGCKLSQVHLVSRHGTRYPSKHDILKFTKMEKLIQSANSTQALPEWLKVWTNPYSLSKASQLHEVGQLDLYNLGLRDQMKYQQFLQSHPYTPELYKIASSAQTRSGESGFAYVLGLFEGMGNLTYAKVIPVFLKTLPKDKDTRLEIKKACPKWLYKQKDNSFLLNQLNLYAQTNFPLMAQKLSAKTHLSIQAYHLPLIYKLCGYAISLENLTQTWCSLLDKKDIESLEFYSDLKGYYLYGYGDPYNLDMASDLFSYIFNSMKHHQKGSINEVATLQFGHSETIQFFVSALGLFNSTNQLKYNFTHSEIKARQYRTSNITPFSSNLRVELYQCRSTLTNIKSYKVLIKLNEKSIPIPKCSDILCPFSEFKHIYQRLTGMDTKTHCKL